MKLNGKVTDEIDFFQGNNPVHLAEQYGTPLYVYNERIIRQRCREMKHLVSYKNFTVNYSAKANSNLAFLQIVKQEGLSVDAMSPGEIHTELQAGFQPDDILFISNNVSKDEMLFAIERDIRISVDSLAQLERFGKICTSGKVVIRFNPGIGAGHHEKVVTGGDKTKFGVNIADIPIVKELLKKYNLTLCGINQHIGSLFMEGDAYIEGAASLLSIAKHFDSLEFVDLGGGFGIPYSKQEGEKRLDLKSIGEKLDIFINDFVKEYGREITFKIEPGRYISAESGVLLGQVHAIKYNGFTKFAGTDIGFNVLMRPAMYGSYHEVEIYRDSNIDSGKTEPITIVGNICESGDILVYDKLLPEIFEGDILGILDAGAYSHVMSSNYNNRLRPAEIMIREDCSIHLARNRDTLEDITRHYRPL